MCVLCGCGSDQQKRDIIKVLLFSWRDYNRHNRSRVWGQQHWHCHHSGKFDGCSTTRCHGNGHSGDMHNMHLLLCAFVSPKTGKHWWDIDAYELQVYACIRECGSTLYVGMAHTIYKRDLSVYIIHNICSYSILTHHLRIWCLEILCANASWADANDWYTHMSCRNTYLHVLYCTFPILHSINMVLFPYSNSTDTCTYESGRRDSVHLQQNLAYGSAPLCLNPTGNVYHEVSHGYRPIYI